MKRAIFIVIGLIAFAAIAIVAAPSFVNWNNYKADITDQVRQLTGRELIIAGDISVKVLPAPRLVAEKVSLSSLEGATHPDLVSLRSVEVQVALAPLITGQVRVETVRLVEPRIHLEVLADGRSTWEIVPPSTETENVDQQTAEGAEPAPVENGRAPAIVIDAFEIVNGRISYEDPSSDVKETIEAINMQIAAASLTTGPYNLEGNLLARDLRLNIDADVGTIVEGRTFPVDASFGIGGDSAQIKVNGTLIGLDAAPRFTGNLAVTAEDIATLAQTFAPGMDLPKPLSQKFSLSGNIDASSVDLTFTEFDIDIGGSTGKGSINGSFGDTPRITSEITIDKIAVDPWLETNTSAPVSSAPAVAAAEAGTPADNSADQQAAPAPFALPTGIDVTADLRVGEVSMRGDAVENVVLSAQLSKGEVTLNQFTMQGPGKLDVAAFGFLTARDGVPTFDTSIEASIENVDELLKWADVQTGLPAGKPGNISFKAKANGTDTSIALQELRLSFDETNISGAANIVLGERLGVGATVKVDSINIDSYLPTGTQQSSPPPEKPAEADATSEDATNPPTAAAKPASGPFAALAPLTEFDANLNVGIQNLTASGIPVRDVKADIGLVAGDLTIRNVSVGNAAGVSSVMTGALNNLGGVPEADNLKTDVKINDLVTLTETLGQELPIPAKDIGKISLTATLGGALTKPRLVSQLQTLDATINAQGSVSPFELGSLFDLVINMQHTDFVTLLGRLGVPYKPSGDIGALSASTRLKGGITGITFSDLLTKVGNANISGDGDLRLFGDRPKLNAVLQTNEIVVDPFLPAQKAASLLPYGAEPKVMPAGFRFFGEESAGLKHLIAQMASRWSKAPIDLSALGLIDADVNLTSPKITYHSYHLENANLVTEVKNKVLTVKDFTGSVFDGAFQSSAIINAATDQPQLSGLVTLGDMDIAKASQAAGVSGASGTLTTRVEVAALGNSVADYVSTLNGKGAISVNGIKGDAPLADMPVVGLALGPLLKVFELLNSGLGAFAKTGLGETNVNSTFVIQNGVIETNDARMLSNLYDGNLAGTINLPTWTMDVGGRVALDQGVIGGLLANVARIPNEIPFQVSGNIDKPNVKIQSIGSSSGGGIQIPGLNKLEEKVPGVGNLLKGILGGGSSGSTAPPSQGGGATPPPQQPPSQQQQPPANPAEQLIRGLLGG